TVRELIEALDDLGRVCIRQRAILPQERTFPRNDVERRAAAYRADIDGGEGWAEAARWVAALAPFFCKAHQEGNQFRRILDGADAEMGLASMDLKPRHGGVLGLDAFMRIHVLHGRSFTDNHGARTPQGAYDAVGH